MSEWVRVAGLHEIDEGSLLGVEAGGEHIVLARVNGKVYALEDQCSHQEYPLSDGELNGERLECIYHGAVFDVCTGQAKQLPAIRAVKTYGVELRDQDIYVHVD